MTEQQQQQQQHHNTNNEDSRFSCNVCFDAVQEPVVTQCGHLYCWPCLYRWLEPGLLPSERQSLGLPPVVNNALFFGGTNNSTTMPESRRVCPVCKAPCSVPTLVPIYVRTEEPIHNSNNNNIATNAKKQETESDEKKEAVDDIDDIDIDDSVLVETVTAATQLEEESAHAATTEAEGEAVMEQEELFAMPTSTNNTTGLRQRLRFRSRDSEIPPQVHSMDLEDDADDLVTNHAQAPLSSSQNNTNTNTSATVPARPLATSPARPRPQQQQQSAASASQQRHAEQQNATTPFRNDRSATVIAALSQGLALSLHHALQGTDTGDNNPASSSSPTAAAAATVIPPLHHPRGGPRAAALAAATSASAAAQQQQQHPLVAMPPPNEYMYASSAWPQQPQQPDPDATEFLSRILLMLGSFVILCLLLF